MADIARATILDAEPLKETFEVEKPLSLVIEILPGQAGEGLIDIYEPGSYEKLSLHDLVHRTLSKKNWSIEEKQVLDDIHRQLSGGKLLIRGKDLQGNVLDHVIMEETEEGEKYLYVPIRALKPQEGGTGGPRRRARGS